MKKIIVVIGENKYQFDTKEELLQNVLGDFKNDYNDMTEKEKQEQRYLKAYINARGNEEKIMNLQEKINQGESNVEFDGKFLIDNDDVYIMSLLTMSDIILLEEKNANFFTKGINKEGIKDNYIVLNAFARDIIETYKDDCLKRTVGYER